MTFYYPVIKFTFEMAITHKNSLNPNIIQSKTVPEREHRDNNYENKPSEPHKNDE